MRFSIRKITALALAVLMAAGLAACGSAGHRASRPGAEYMQKDGNGKDAAEFRAKEEQINAAEEQPEAAESGKAEDKGAGEPDEISPLHLTQVNTILYRLIPDTYNYRYYVNDSYVELAEDTGKRYPELAAALDAFNGQQKQSLNESIEWLESESEMFFSERSDPGFDEYLYSNDSCCVLRADSNVLSMLLYGETYSGGAHPISGYGGVTFHTGTGKKLELEDVVTDPDAFARLVDERLRVEYAEEYEYFYSDPVEVIKEGSMDWTLGYEEITVYFSAYTLGPYAMGEQCITVNFSEAPELFCGAFTEAADSYIVPLRDGSPLERDLFGSGEKESIRLQYVPVDEYAGNWLVCRGSSSCDLNTYGYDQESYLVRSDGKYYVYVFVTVDNDYRLLYTVDLSSMTSVEPEPPLLEPAGIGYVRTDYDDGGTYVSKYALLTDPAEFRLTSRIDMLSTMSAEKRYHTGPAGCPAEDEDALTVHSDRLLKTRQTVEADLVDRNGDVIGSTEIPPGTCLSFVRTDGKTYMDMQEADPAHIYAEETEWYCYYYAEEMTEPDWSGPVYRIRVDKNDWPHTVNGFPEDDVFAGIGYAG